MRPLLTDREFAMTREGCEPPPARHAGRVPAILYARKRAPRAAVARHTKAAACAVEREILLVDHAA